MDVTSTQGVTGRPVPWLQSLRESWEMIDSTPWCHACLELVWQSNKAGNMGMLAGVSDCRSSQKPGFRGRLVLGFKQRHSSRTRERATRPWQGGESEKLGFARVGITADTIWRLNDAP